jgi:hypothetical protein
MHEQDYHFGPSTMQIAFPNLEYLLRISGFGFPLDFGFRVSDLAPQ